MPSLVAIARREKSRAAMEELATARIETTTGLEGDSRGRSKGRQVTLLSREAWDEACRELGRELPWTTRRANLLVEGLPLPRKLGARLRVGEALLEVAEETKPCPRMEEAAPGLQAALVPEWRGGITCRVLQAGAIRIGDAVAIEPVAE